MFDRAARLLASAPIPANVRRLIGSRWPKSLTREGRFENYVRSMPSEYRARFDDQAMRRHAAIVHARNASPVHVGVLQSERGIGICIVADDRPGLLSAMTAALAFSELDVEGAEAYCRSRDDGRVEAVDFFWLLRGDRVDVDRLSFVLQRLLEADGEVALTPETESERTQRVSSPPHSIRFEEDELLVVHCADRRTVLPSITHALFASRASITSSDVRVTAGRLYARFALVEFDGSTLSELRRVSVIERVSKAIASDDSPRNAG